MNPNKYPTFFLYNIDFAWNFFKKIAKNIFSNQIWKSLQQKLIITNLKSKLF